MNCPVELRCAGRVVLFSLVGTAAATAQPLNTDKSGYNLFNPTPRGLMRPLSADRPDVTESPYTVDAGHVQFELSFFDYAHDDDGGEKFHGWAFFDTNAKIGLLNNMDLQFVFSAYTEERTTPNDDLTETLDGFGDVAIRAKLNLWGNDGGETAFAILPFVKIPTGGELSNGRTEGGIVAVLGWEVAQTWGLAFQAEGDFVYDDEDDNYDTEFSHTAVLGFDMIGPLGAFVEYVGMASSDPDSDYLVIFSSGLTYLLTEDLMLDAGTQIGLNSAANDIDVFVGMTIRF